MEHIWLFIVFVKNNIAWFLGEPVVGGLFGILGFIATVGLTIWLVRLDRKNNIKYKQNKLFEDFNNLISEWCLANH